MFGESRMGCRNNVMAHIDPPNQLLQRCNGPYCPPNRLLQRCNGPYCPPNRLLQRCNGHIDLRISCCNDVTAILTSEWDRTRKNYALGYSQSQL